MVQAIKDRIAALKFDDFQISRIDKKEHQLYLLRSGVESERDVESRYYEVTVYLDRQTRDGRRRGSYTFNVKLGEDIDRHLEQARTGCALVKNRVYKLTAPMSYPRVEMLDPRLKSPRGEAGILADQIMSRAENDGVILSSAEIFITTAEVELCTSTGIEARKEKGRIVVDLTLLSSAEDREGEMHFNLERRNLDHLGLAGIIERHQGYCRDLLQAKTPPNRRADVAFDSTMINNLFFPLVLHASGRIKDQGISKLEVGKPLTPEPPRGDSLTLVSSGIIPYGLHSDPFDEEGIPGQEHTVIDQGVFKKYLSSKQYADYLGSEPTGTFKNTVLKPAGPDHPMPDDYIEVVKFSDLSPDPFTGDFVAEIRFGYLHRKGERIPVKGGSISGNAFQCLADLSFSRSETFLGDYLGPDRVLVRNLAVAGE